MKTILTVLLLSLAPIQAQAEPPHREVALFMSGNDLVQSMIEYNKAQANRPAEYYSVGDYRGYVTAVYDVYSSEGIICPGEKTPNGPVLTIVSNFLEANPSKWSGPAVVLVRDALITAFPCK